MVEQTVRWSGRTISINPKFYRGQSEHVKVPEGFSLVELFGSTGLYTKQLMHLYEQTKRKGLWKYDPPEMVLGGLGEITDYHILLALHGNSHQAQVAGTVRSIFLPGANFVFGSALVVAEAFANQGLSLPLIFAAMTVADEDSLRIGQGGIVGAVLGIDDDPRMRAFHERWHVGFVPQGSLPFAMPSIDDTPATERIMGIRWSGADKTTISARRLSRILDDLCALELQLGYPLAAVQTLYESLNARLAGTVSLPLLTADAYKP